MKALLGVPPSNPSDAATKAYVDNLVPFLSQSGYYLMPPAYLTTNASSGLGTAYGHLMIVPRAMTFTGFQIDVTTFATSGTCRNGIYLPDATSGLPNSLYKDFGTLTSTASTGVKSISITAFTLQPGVYWMATMSTVGTPTMRAVAGFYNGSPIAATITAGTGGVYNASPYTGTALNSMPATFTANSGSIITTANAPQVGLQIQ